MANNKEVLLSYKKQAYYYYPDELIGKGNFGRVCVGKDAFGKIYAIKKISKSAQIKIEQMLSEIEIMEKCINKRNLAYCVDKIETSDNYYIVMPYYECGNLGRFLKDIKSEYIAIEFLRQICYGLRQLHNEKIAHRDIKAENIFISKCTSNNCGYSLSIGDYGLSRYIIDNPIVLTACVGTPNTRAPEVVSGAYSVEADIYSVGVVFYQMLTHLLPFICNSTPDLIALQNRTTYMEVKKYFEKPISKFSLMILEGCLQYHATKRMRSSELFDCLQLDKLYENYIEIPLDIVDINSFINYKNFDRKDLCVKNTAVCDPQNSIDSGEKTPPMCANVEFDSTVDILYLAFAKMDQQLHFIQWLIKYFSENGFDNTINQIKVMHAATNTKIETVKCPYIAMKNIGMYIAFVFYSIITEEKSISDIPERIILSKSLKWGLHDAMLMVTVIYNIIKKDIPQDQDVALLNMITNFIEGKEVKYIQAQIDVSNNIISIIYKHS